MKMRERLIVSVSLLIFLIIIPSLAADIPASERLHLRDVIQYGQQISYINAGIIPCGDGDVYILSPDNSSISTTHLTAYTYIFDKSTGQDDIVQYTQVCNGGNFGGATLSPGGYYVCTAGNPTTSERLTEEISIRNCYLVFTVLPHIPSSANISVNSTPPGAQLYLDNGAEGITPYIISNVPNGQHTILLKMDGYQDYTSNVLINGTNQSINAVLTPNVISTPTQSLPLETSIPSISTSITTLILRVTPESTAPQPSGDIFQAILKFFGL